MYRNELVEVIDRQRRRGWRLLATPAIVKHAGPSCGVLAAVRASIPAGLPLEPLHIPAQGRIKVVKLDSYLPGGILLVSLYLRTAEGLSQENLQILQDLEVYLAGVQQQWIIAGD